MEPLSPPLFPAAGLLAVRARTVIPLTGEGPARGEEALARPLARIDDGLILVRDGIILAVEPYQTYARRPDALPAAAIHDLGDVVLVPGLVNCHTHLELSHLQGKTRLGNGFCDWVASLVACEKADAEKAAAEKAAAEKTDAEKTGADSVREEAAEALAAAVAALVRAGTACVGDIAGRRPRDVLTAARSARLACRIFHEVLGHDPAAPGRAGAAAAEDPAFSLAGHAFYTTPGEAMVAAKAWCAAHSRPFSLHLAEHEDETRCILTGDGPLHALLQARVLPPAWTAPRMRPVPYAAALGLLAPGTLAVHCVHCTREDIAAIASGGAAVCLCPRSNAAINVGEAPARAFAAKGVLLCLGTDSLASNTDLDVWNEAVFFFQKNIFPANALLRMATVNGASVLGLADQVGRLESGRRFCYRTFPDTMNALFR